MENHALLINTSDVETGNAVRGTEEANNTVPNTREENSKGISNIINLPIHDINDIVNQPKE